MTHVAGIRWRILSRWTDGRSLRPADCVLSLAQLHSYKYWEESFRVFLLCLTLRNIAMAISVSSSSSSSNSKCV